MTTASFLCWRNWPEPTGILDMTEPSRNGRLAGRVTLITGASRGLGAALAARFAAEGAQLVLTARTVGGLEETDDAVRAAGGEAATLVPLDLRMDEGIERLSQALAERFGRLDVLVGNAGVLGAMGPLTHCKPEVWDEVLDVNLTANWRLLRALDPLLRQSEGGRAIFVSSGAASGPRAYWGAYAVTKAALEMMVGIYAAEIEKTKVRANLVDPGRLRTAMRAKAYPGENPDSLPDPASVTECFLRLAEASCQENGALVRAYE